MVISRALIVLLFFLNLNHTLAWDGCHGSAWRCGDTCIYGGYYPGEEALCMCGEEIFNHTAQMWCCNDKPCEGRGEKDTKRNYWPFPGGQPGLGAHQRSSGKSSGGNLGVGSQLEGAGFRPQLGRTWCCACLLELAFNQNPEPA